MTKPPPAGLERYCVDPRPPSLPARPEDVKTQWDAPSGPLYVFLWVFPINPIAVNFLGLPLAILGIPATYALYWFHGVLKGVELRQRLQDQNEAAWRKTLEDLNQKAQAEAQQKASSLRSYLLSARQHLDSLFISLDAASRALDEAVSEHRERAFGPFWDAIETAAAALAEYQHGTKEIGAIAQEYYKELEHRTHTFPPFPYIASDLPIADESVKRFKQVVRMGQTDFEFANIWEHRKTRETIKTGFGSLEAAVRQVGSSVVTAVQGVRLSLESGFDRLVESNETSTSALLASADAAAEQRERQRREVCGILESQDRKLDRIQWRHKPSGTSY